MSPERLIIYRLNSLSRTGISDIGRRTAGGATYVLCSGSFCRTYLVSYGKCPYVSLLPKRLPIRNMTCPAPENRKHCPNSDCQFFTASTDADATAAVLKYAGFVIMPMLSMQWKTRISCRPYRMPKLSEWMEENIPLFECPQRILKRCIISLVNLRKHIKDTPVGYGMTEFLVNRSYADQYNLIACAVGHHIYESRWLRRPNISTRSSVHGIVATGNPMKKMMNFSSDADAVFNRYLVSGDRAFTMDLLPDLEAEYCSVGRSPSARRPLLAG